MTLDHLVIGAGPAGLQLGALLEADGRRDYLVVDRADSPGSFFARYPRHRRLISINKPRTGSDDPEVNLRHDWNSLLSDDPDLRFTRYTDRYFPDADVMVQYLADFAERSKVRVRYGAPVTRVSRRTDDAFEVQVGSDTLTARTVVVATGVSLPHRPAIPGFELAEGYDVMSVDPADYLDQRVLVVGKGNSAFETADALMETTTAIHVAGPEPVHLAWRTHYVGHLRAVNNNFLDTYQLKSGNAVLDGRVERIERDGDRLAVTFWFTRADETRVLHYDRVLACTGFAFDASVFDETCRPALTIGGRFPEQTDEWESVDQPGLFFAGTLTQQRDFRRSTNGFVHGFRYGARALHRILERRAGEPWPSTPLDPAPEAVAAAVVARVNRTSALWQQFGVLADVVTVTGDVARYHEEVPVEYHRRVGLAPLGHDDDAFVVTLEYGPDHDKVDPFDVTQHRVMQDAPGQAHDAAYLHPVVRHHRHGEHLATHHLAENLENRWDRPDVHVGPLVDFVARALAGR
ncbi:FAD dependent oxidoreductase [Cellulomonas flavigena DSM 20109]|uniref:FAD dependent oxidoreductase n=1 Tax=Cellulomonas flavigena (strain ATCC 482 / DSM 20109 / BCRC 11376 / JCM 18109 / NBRC 3775 / NCIMB 8073 / NRS 134) TaxID=446466 RepID=D5UG01_CELFN|nr:NAD(P)-binding domain-containing protein [Cellulomonas flavigena]ADG75024.1 FAD dependent oxidoreductase [Cellulomonas flavigena DSM 20109]